MAKADSTIQSFPAHIDRDHFASWFSGFVDGEGSFLLWLMGPKNAVRKTPVASLAIALRIDDRDILHLINSFFRCGRVLEYEIRNALQTRNACRQARWTSVKAADNFCVMLPHFEKFPLLAKKARDFAIWKEGVVLIHSVVSRGRRGYGPRRGCARSWTDDEISHFVALRETLHAQRKFNAPPSPPPPPPEDNYPLFR